MTNLLILLLLLCGLDCTGDDEYFVDGSVDVDPDYCPDDIRWTL